MGNFAKKLNLRQTCPTPSVLINIAALFLSLYGIFWNTLCRDVP